MGGKEREGTLMKRLRIQGSFFLEKLPRILLKTGEGRWGLGLEGKEVQTFLGMTAWHSLDVWGFCPIAQ